MKNTKNIKKHRIFRFQRATNCGCSPFLHPCPTDLVKVFSPLGQDLNTNEDEHPCLSVPMELFPSVGMKISIKIPMGIENLLFPAQKMPVVMVLECNFVHSILNGDKILGQFRVGSKF